MLHAIVHSGGIFGPSEEVWDLDEAELRERILHPYNNGTPITVGGLTFTKEDPPRVEVYEGPSRTELKEAGAVVMSLGLLALNADHVHEVTDRFVHGPYGHDADSSMPVVRRDGGDDIFVVHGRNLDAAGNVARRIEKAVGSAHRVVLLGEEPDDGQTVIEKLEKAAETVGFAVVLLTADDVGRLSSESELRPRARQNVILELGYFMARLGRAHVAALAEGTVELPSDFLGVLHIERDSDDWDMRLIRRLREAGLSADLNRLVEG